VRVLLQDVRKELSLMPPPDVKEKEKGLVVDPQRTEIAMLDTMYSRVTAQHIGLDLELKGAISRVTRRQDASTPLQKDTKKQILGTVFAGLMGFGLIGLGVVAHETRVRKVSSLGELRATGPTAVVGVVPWVPDGGTARDPAKRADVNEAIDKLRSYVAQTWLARGATTVAVTSPLGDEGKSFTAFGLASSLAQAGYRTLLIDFDLRNPSLHPYAGVPNGVGVCELLRSEAEARHAVVTLPNGLHFLPAGKWSDEARQAAVGGRLETLLARLREPFDCVVLHGHALLTAAESVEVARRAEVVLLCTLYRETRLPLLKRATERVAAMEVPYSGVVYLGATPNEALC
jgi:Mrp family chromosome partitioning ATPase